VPWEGRSREPRCTPIPPPSPEEEPLEEDDWG
jgi:hypothetical protein